MKPYYESWKHSKHNKIACVECHISPGITAEVRKKYEALSMVAKYFTGTYSTKPWAEVDDAACLRCHERRLLEGKVMFHGVQFDHRPHLTESRRGLRLRCTSCHSQIVQGVHITVTVSTCALCHFKGQGANQGLGTCTQLPHDPGARHHAGRHDRSITARSAPRPCTARRATPASCAATATVPRERCLQCHNQADRLAHYGEQDFLHDWHVLEAQGGLPELPLDHRARPAQFGRAQGR